MASFDFAWGGTGGLGALIPNIGVGIAELIKNSYDADASRVTVDLNRAFEKNLDKATILVSDDGHGMTKWMIENNFFKVGYSNKTEAEHRVSPNGRLRVGEFGVGRFALQKIAKKVTVITRAKNNDTFDFLIDWDAPDNKESAKDVDIPINCNTQAYSSFFPDDKTGTFLILEGLREPILIPNTNNPKKNLRDLHTKIQELINPFDEIPDFTPVLLLPSSEKKWEDLDTKAISNSAQYSLIASIDHTGAQVEYRFENRHPWSESEGTSETGSWKTKDLLGGQDCRINQVKIWIYFLSTDSKLTKVTGKTGVVAAKEIEKIRGFRMYRGHHRVFPYGELNTVNGDWLQLASLWGKRTDKYWRQKDLIAAVTVNPTANPRIRDMTNRAGLDETLQPEQGQLVTLLQQVVAKMRAMANPIPKVEPEWMKKPEIDYPMFSGLILGDEISLKPQNNASIPTKWKIDGDLPKGLRFDKKSGIISGTPSSLMDPIEYSVTGSNKIGESKCKFVIEVKPKEVGTVQTKIVDPEPQPVSPTRPVTPVPPDDPSILNAKRKIQGHVQQLTQNLNSITYAKDLSGIRKKLEHAKSQINLIESMLKEIDE